MTLLFGLLLGLARADEIFDVKIDILINTCNRTCKAERIGPFAHSIVLREKPEGLTGQYEWFERLDDGYYVSLRVIRGNGAAQYRVQAYVANGDEVGSSAAVSAWVNEPAALNRLQIGPPSRKRDGIVHNITLTVN